MRRKDYEVVADALAALPLAPADQETVVATLYAAFAQENPKFDPDKFRAAALLESGVRRAIDPEALTRMLIDYLVASAQNGELPTLSSIVDVAKESALSTERAAGGSP